MDISHYVRARTHTQTHTQAGLCLSIAWLSSGPHWACGHQPRQEGRAQAGRQQPRPAGGGAHGHFDRHAMDPQCKLFSASPQAPSINPRSLACIRTGDNALLQA
eukprot:scaffold217498_cov22-Tisochrysis_lutea.AAC.1